MDSSDSKEVNVVDGLWGGRSLTGRSVPVMGIMMSRKDPHGITILWELPIWSRRVPPVPEGRSGRYCSDKRILCSGYNGAPSGIAHCNVTGCLRAQLIFHLVKNMNSAEGFMPNKMPSFRRPAMVFLFRAHLFIAPIIPAPSVQK